MNQLLIEHKPMHPDARPVVRPKTLKQYLMEKKEAKLRVGKRTPLRTKMFSLMQEMSKAGIRYKTPRKLYKHRRFNKRMWSGYYSYLIEQVRRVM